VAINIGRVRKDPDDTMDIPIEWEAYLLGATIASASCPSPPAGITVSSTAVNPTGGTRVIHRVTGGTEGQEYTLTCRVVPTSGGQLDLEFTVAIV
jgi:hypothetical protein